MNSITSSVCRLTWIHLIVLADSALVEDPSKTQAAAAVPVDVLFASFEKFLKRAWREHMGPILPPSAISNMQLGIGIHVYNPLSMTRADTKFQILGSPASSQTDLNSHLMR